MSLFLDPTKAALPIPDASREFLAQIVQEKQKSYRIVYQITIENLQEGIVGIYTDQEGRYYRVAKQVAASVVESFQETSRFSEEEKVSRLNSLIREIVNQPDQIQIQGHFPTPPPPKAQLREMFRQAIEDTPAPAESKMILKDILKCHSRRRGWEFYVAVGIPTQASGTEEKKRGGK